METIDLLDLQILSEHHLLEATTFITRIFPVTYQVSAQDVTLLKTTPCCMVCFPKDPNFLNRRRNYRSNAARIAALKMKAITCLEDSSEEDE